MIKTFIREIDKQIASNQELYDQTNLEIFKERIQKLASLKGEILTSMQDRESISHYLISVFKIKKEFLQAALKSNL